MIKISGVVENIIKNSPILWEAMESDIANLSEVARQIKKPVENELMFPVSEAAIVMALRRLHIKPQKTKNGFKILQGLKNITVQSNLVEFSFLNPTNLLQIHENILKLTAKKDSFLNISRGLFESIVVVSQNLEKDVEKILKGQKQIKKYKNLASITLQLPEECTFASGVYYPIIKALAWNNISFVEIISIASEVSFVFEDKNIDKAFTTIKSMVDKQV